MKRIILVSVFAFWAFVCHAQQVVTLDGIDLGDRSELIDACVEGIGSEMITAEGMSISSRRICTCIVDSIFTRMTATQLEEMLETGEADEFLYLYLEELMACAGDDIQVADDYVFSNENVNSQTRDIAVKVCAEAMMESAKEDGLPITRSQADEFCTCAMDKMLAAGYQYADLQKMEEQDGAVFNEVLLACLEPLLGTGGLSSNVYNPSDIAGRGAYTEVKLLNFASVGRKIKMTFDGVEKYFLFDTGASEVIISTELERQLLLKGAITEEQYLGVTTFQLADGTMVEARVVSLNNVRIGDYTVNNLVVAILDQGGMLCGMGLLNKFKKWEIKGDNTLILYR